MGKDTYMLFSAHFIIWVHGNLRHLKYLSFPLNKKTPYIQHVSEKRNEFVTVTKISNNEKRKFTLAHTFLKYWVK